MYVCLCNGHRDSDIRRATGSGLRCVREIYESLGGAPRCGRCLPHARSLIADASAAIGVSGGCLPESALLSPEKS
jgi:bacterioferritin-associated ferredoxin